MSRRDPLTSFHHPTQTFIISRRESSDPKPVAEGNFIVRLQTAVLGRAFCGAVLPLLLRVVRFLPFVTEHAIAGEV
jgi:hypothetical protein